MKFGDGDIGDPLCKSPFIFETRPPFFYLKDRSQSTKHALNDLAI